MSIGSIKPIIDLINFDGLGLIISFPSGVIYTNQVGGYACLHPEIEGVFFPLAVKHKKILFALESHFRGDWNHLQAKDADVVDKLLRSEDFGHLKVDRSKLKESFEAWIYVEVGDLTRTFPLISGFGKTKGILTWANSD